MTDADILPVFPEKPPRWKVTATNVVKRYLLGACCIVARAERDLGAGRLVFNEEQQQLLHTAAASMVRLVNSWQRLPNSYDSRQRRARERRRIDTVGKLTSWGSDD